MKAKITLLLLFFALAFSCERDDLCPEDVPTTPRLIIDFYDDLNQENLKTVTDLRIEDAANSDNVIPEYNVQSVSQVILPLKTTENTTQYIFYKDYEIDDNGTPDDTTDDMQLGNPDTVTITYARTEVYVSRACGYKNIFTNVIITIEPDSDNWILSAPSINDNQTVENETETHFNIFH